MKKVILNSKGEPVVLNAMEQKIADYNQKLVLNAGYEIDITTLTQIQKSVVEQKFFEIPIADYLPVVVGEGAWSAALTTFRSFSPADSFSSGIINTGSNNTGLANADSMVDSVTVAVRNWAKQIGWTLPDLQLASKAGNWDLITAKQKSIKRNWDLGIQQIAFLGLESDTSVPGLLSQTDVNEDTSTISKFISAMTSSEFAAFCAAIYEKYRANCNRTAKPTHFIIPEADYNGLAAPYDPSFPIKTKLQALEETFTMLTGNKSFKILPLAYANKAIQGSKNVYTLLNYDEDSVKMNIPVNFTSTLANTVNGFQYQSVSYGQFSGTKAYRPLEMLYFSNTI